MKRRSYEVERKPELLTIKDWGIRYGIKIIDPKGFRGSRNKVLSRLYTRGQFIRGIKRSRITVKTEKGLAFLEVI